jgi:hypothetical protein
MRGRHDGVIRDVEGNDRPEAVLVDLCGSYFKSSRLPNTDIDDGRLPKAGFNGIGNIDGSWLIPPSRCRHAMQNANPASPGTYGHPPGARSQLPADLSTRPEQGDEYRRFGIRTLHQQSSGCGRAAVPTPNLTARVQWGDT